MLSRLLLTASAALLLSASLIGCDDAAVGPANAGVGDTAVTDTTGTDVGATDTAQGLDTTAATWQEDLAFLREEEKLARDVYITLFAKWGVKIFDNISNSEQMHTTQVANLLVANNLPDPVVDDTVGVFVNPVLAGLYTDLTTQGSTSLVAGLIVGVTIEDLDINDIDHMIARTDDPAILALYDALGCGSRNHLRSFMSQLDKNGGTYEPQFISKERFDAILAGSGESCGGN